MSCGGASCGDGCCGSCGSCGGSGGRELWVTPGEIELLERFAQYAFLPVARKWDSEIPVYLEDGPEKAVLWGDLLTAMQFKGLINIDYDLPLAGFDYAGYEGYPCRGSMALTAEGQRAIEILEIQGAEE